MNSDISDTVSTCLADAWVTQRDSLRAGERPSLTATLAVPSTPVRPPIKIYLSHLVRTNAV